MSGTSIEFICMWGQIHIVCVLSFKYWGPNWIFAHGMSLQWGNLFILDLCNKNNFAHKKGRKVEQSIGLHIPLGRTGLGTGTYCTETPEDVVLMLVDEDDNDDEECSLDGERCLSEVLWVNVSPRCTPPSYWGKKQKPVVRIINVCNVHIKMYSCFHTCTLLDPLISCWVVSIIPPWLCVLIPGLIPVWRPFSTSGWVTGLYP